MHRRRSRRHVGLIREPWVLLAITCLLSPPRLSSLLRFLLLSRRRLTRRLTRKHQEGVPEERWISSTFPPNSPRCLRQGQVTEAWLDFLGDMQVGDQGDRSVDHLPGSGNDTGAAAEPVAQAAVRAFESDGLVLAGIMPAR